HQESEVHFWRARCPHHKIFTRFLLLIKQVHQESEVHLVRARCPHHKIFTRFLLLIKQVHQESEVHLVRARCPHHKIFIINICTGLGLGNAIINRHLIKKIRHNQDYRESVIHKLPQIVK
ncbi:MAG: hypothetical protein ACKPIB_16715, partial [Dolichospermum sp.]